MHVLRRWLNLRFLAFAPKGSIHKAVKKRGAYHDQLLKIQHTESALSKASTTHVCVLQISIFRNP